MSLKVFHTGDLHLGMLYQNRGYPEDVRRELMEARFRVLEQMIETANREACQLFIIAGDLFERLRMGEEMVLRAARALARFSGVCAVLPGNHDYYAPDTPLWAKFQEHAADNVVLLFETRPYSLQEQGLDVVLYPAPCHTKHSSENRLGWIFELPEKPAASWHFGLAHGSLQGYSPDFFQNYFPMREEELGSAGLHFWFLGHTHVRIPAGDQISSGFFACCGTPEPDGFDCRHGGSAWLFHFEDGGSVEGRALNTGLYSFRDLHKHVSTAEEIEELARELSRQGKSTLARLKLKGTLPREDFESRHEWREGLREKLFYLEWDDTELQMEISRETIAELFQENSFPYLLLNRLAETGEQKALQLAYTLIKEVKK